MYMCASCVCVHVSHLRDSDASCGMEPGLHFLNFL